MEPESFFDRFLELSHCWLHPVPEVLEVWPLRGQCYQQGNERQIHFYSNQTLQLVCTVYHKKRVDLTSSTSWPSCPIFATYF